MNVDLDAVLDAGQAVSMAVQLQVHLRSSHSSAAWSGVGGALRFSYTRGTAGVCLQLLRDWMYHTGA